MKEYNLFLIATIVFLTSACVRPKFTRRFSQLDTLEQTIDKDKFIRVVAHSYDMPNSGKAIPKVTDLSDRGQDAYMRMLLEAYKDSNVSEKAFVKTALTPVLGSSKTNYQKRFIKRRIVVSTDPISDIPGERFQKLSIEIELNSNKVKFVSWDKIETKYEVIDLGKLNYNTTGSFSLTGSNVDSSETSDTIVSGISKKISGARSISPVLSNTRSLTEDISLNEKFIGISGTLTDEKLTLIREGAKGITLQGNIIIDCTIEILPNSTPLFYTIISTTNNVGGGFKPTINWKFSRQKIDTTPLSADVDAKCSTEFVYRAYKDSSLKYAATISEHDDVIKLIKGSAEATTFQLIDARSMERDWYITNRDVTNIGRIQYRIKGSAKREGFLLFPSLKQVDGFRKNITTRLLKTPLDANKVIELDGIYELIYTSGTLVKFSDVYDWDSVPFN